LHQPGKHGVFDRTHDDVPVLVEDAVRYKPRGVLFEAIGQSAKEGLVVAPLAKDRPAA